MGRSIGKIRSQGFPAMPVVPTENKGIMSGPMRKPRGGRRKIDRRGSFPKPGAGGRGFRQPPPGYKYDEIDRLVPIDTPPLGKKVVSRRIFPKDRPLTGGYDPKSGVRYTDTGVPTAVEQTRRVPVQDPTLGGPPEREVPIPRERRPRITRESDPRGEAPFAPDDSAAKDRFFETMFERAANQKERRAIDKAERRDTQESMREEAMLREREMSDRGRTRRRTRRKDFTRRRPEKRRSREERAAFRDRYVSTLGSNFFS